MYQFNLQQLEKKLILSHLVKKKTILHKKLLIFGINKMIGIISLLMNYILQL